MAINPKTRVEGVPCVVVIIPAWLYWRIMFVPLQKSLPGAPCSDAAGCQVPCEMIMKQVNSSVSGIQWDKDQNPPYYNYKDAAGRTHHVWCDDP